MVFEDIVQLINIIQTNFTTVISFLLIGYVLVEFLDKRERSFGDKMMVSIIWSFGVSGLIYFLFWTVSFFKIIIFTLADIVYYSGLVEWILIVLATFYYIFSILNKAKVKRKAMR